MFLDRNAPNDRPLNHYAALEVCLNEQIDEN